MLPQIPTVREAWLGKDWQCSLFMKCPCPAQALIERHMLTSDEEASLRDSLRFREQDRWLHLLYRRGSSFPVSQ